ncbi:MAG: hypothetical protein V9E96_19050 [Chitinophagaceae bacterium]
MLRNYLLLLLVIATSACVAQNLASPDQFLGYKVGTKVYPAL